MCYWSKSYLSEYGCGFDVKNNDISTICELLGMIKGYTPDEVKKISAIGREASKERFNYENLAHEFLNILEV